MTATVERDIGLLPHQKEAWEAPEPYVAMVTGLGGGKTWYGAFWLIMRAIEFPQSVHLATANTIGQLKDVVIPQLLDTLEFLGISCHYHMTDKILTLDLGDEKAVIWCRGMENPNKTLRGPEFGSWWGDEVRDYSEEAVTVATLRLRCQLVDKCRYLWTTTPNGFDHVYNRHVDEATENHRLVTASTDDNHFLPSQYLELMEASCDGELMEQERHAKFLNLGGGLLYKRYDRTVNKREGIELNPRAPVYLCIDNNPKPLVCEIVQEDAQNTYAVDEIFMRNGGDWVQACQMLRPILEHHKGGIILDGDARCGDVSAQTGKSDYALIRECLAIWYNYGIETVARRSNPPIVDRINAVNYRLCDPHGVSRFFISPRCKELLKDLEQVTPKKDARHPDGSKDKMRTHCSDAIGYQIAKRHGVSAFKDELDELKAMAR